MRKTTAVCIIVVIVVLSLCAISIMAAQNDFSGAWVLDKGKTHGLPKGFKSYTMAVTQNEQQLVVESQVSGGGPSNSGSSLIGVVAGKGGANRGYAGEGGVAAPGTLALSMVNPEVIYSLDGKEKIVQFPGSPNVKIKAKWSKDGKTLDLSLVQEGTLTRQTEQGSLTTQAPGITIKERWTLSEGGEVLKIQRTVGTAAGSDAIILIFRKGASGAPTPQR